MAEQAILRDENPGEEGGEFGQPPIRPLNAGDRDLLIDLGEWRDDKAVRTGSRPTEERQLLANVRQLDERRPEGRRRDEVLGRDDDALEDLVGNVDRLDSLALEPVDEDEDHLRLCRILDGRTVPTPFERAGPGELVDRLERRRLHLCRLQDLEVAVNLTRVPRQVARRRQRLLELPDPVACKLVQPVAWQLRDELPQARDESKLGRRKAAVLLQERQSNPSVSPDPSDAGDVGRTRTELNEIKLADSRRATRSCEKKGRGQRAATVSTTVVHEASLLVRRLRSVLAASTGFRADR
jgi:hypothetical protein